MELRLPTVTVQPKGDALRIMHLKTGMVAEVSKKQLDAWCVRQLRAELVAPKGK